MRELGPTEVRIDGEIYDTSKDYYKLEDVWGMKGIVIEGAIARRRGKENHANNFSPKTLEYLKNVNKRATRPYFGQGGFGGADWVLPKSDR